MESAVPLPSRGLREILTKLTMPQTVHVVKITRGNLGSDSSKTQLLKRCEIKLHRSLYVYSRE